MNWKKAAVIAIAVAGIWILSRLPHPAVDIGKLEPVEVVLITRTETGIQLETDSGASGEGQTLDEAVEDLKQADSKEVFLDTADKLLLRGDLTGYWEEIWPLFRPACQVCRVIGEIDLTEAGEYLSMHPTDQTLGKLRGGLGQEQTLEIAEGRGQLAPKSE